MTCRRSWIAAIAALALAGATPPVLAQSTRPGVVIQVTDDSEKTWNQALNVIRNIQVEYGKNNVDVELVVFGHGAGMLKFDAPVANRIDEAIDNGTKVLMCQNSMKARNLVAADMHGRIGYVKAGVVEMIEKHRQGWTLIRP